MAHPKKQTKIRSNNGRVYPELYMAPTADEKEATYYAALELVALAPDDARSHDLLGWAYHLTGQHGAGERALLQALGLDPDLVNAHYHLGSLYLTTGQRELARFHLQRAADLDQHGFYRDRAEQLLYELE